MPRSALLILFTALLFAGCETAKQSKTVNVPIVAPRYSDGGAVKRDEFGFGPAAAHKRTEFKLHTKAVPAERLNINYGSAANDGTGDGLRTLTSKANSNFVELYANMTTVSNLANGSAAAKMNTNAGTSYGQTAIGLSNKVTGGTVFRGIDDRFAERVNVKDHGARGDNSTDDTTAFRAAIARAIATKASVFIPSGVYLLGPDSGASVLNCDALTDSVAYGSLLIEGVDGANRLNRLDTTPDETYSRGAVIKFTGNMAGKVGIQSGTNVNNFRLRNLTIIGTGFDVTTSVGVRHNATSSKFEMDNVTLQHWGTAVDIGGDYATVGDSHADFNVLRRVFISYSDTGVKVNNFQACVNELYSCEISARIPIWNGKSVAGATASPDVKIFGGFLAPLTEYNGVLISSSVSAAAGQTITVGALTKTVKVRDSSFVLGTNITVASASDIAVGMYCVIESNASATGASRPNNWGVLNIVSAVNTGTGVVTLTGNVDTTSLVGKNVWFVTPAIALYGGHFTLNGTRIEATLSDDFQFGPMIAHLLEWQSGTVFNDVDVKLYQTGGFNANLPKITQEPVYSYHGSPMTIKGGSWEVTYPKMQVAAAHGVSERGVTWLVEPLYLDSTGKIADGVRRAQFSQLSGVRTTTPSAAEHRSRVLKAGADEYQIVGGLLKRPIRSVTTAPTTGVSGEVSVLETSPRQFYSVAQTSSLDAYYDSTAISAGNAAISSGSTIATVSDFTGLYVGRAITIAGAGAAGADLTTRIVDCEETAAGTKRLHLYTAAGTTVAAGAISAVSATIESPVDSSAIRIPGGAGGAAMLTFIRSGTATNYISENGGQLSFHEATSGRTMFRGNHSASTNAADFLGHVTMPTLTITNAATLGGSPIATQTGTETLANKTLTTPTIGSFANAGHTHQDAAGGGTLNASAIAAGTVATARLGSGSASSSTYLRGDQTWAAVTSGTTAHYIDVTAAPYSAVPDGSTDNTTAFNNAIAALGNPATNALYVPGAAAAYMLRPLNNLPAGLVIYGDGKTLSKIALINPTANDRMFYTTNSGVTLRDLWLVGSNANFNVSSSPVAITGIVHQATGAGGVYNCKFEGWKVGLFFQGNGDPTARMNPASYRNNNATNNWAGIFCSGDNESEYTSVQDNKVQKCYNGIYNFGAGNVLISDNNVNDCNYPYYHGGAASVSKGNSLVMGNLFNHGQVWLGTPGGGSGTLRFSANAVQGGGQLVLDGTGGACRNVTVADNDLSISYIFFGSGTIDRNLIINNTWGGGNTPNRYNWTGPGMARFHDNWDSANSQFVFEGTHTPYTRAVTGTATVTRLDEVLKCTGTFVVNLPSATVTTFQQADAVGVVQPWGFRLVSISGTQTVTPAAGNINGAATLSVVGPTVKYIFTDGANWYAH